MYLKAIANGEKYGNYRDLGIWKNNLAIFYFEQARYNEAKTAVEEALVIARNAGLKETEASALEGLSLLKSLGY